MSTEQSAIRDRIGSLVPKGSVSDGAEDIAAFSASNPLLDSHRPPGCIVRPGDAVELQKVIRLANETGLNLAVASSSGKHHRGGFGSSSENILIDLSVWKNIDRIDRRNRVCMIGPGVTYGELLDALEPHGMTISMPIAPRRGKSVLASVMDREPSTWPNKQWDAGDPVASTEFIFGNGETFRTGAAGGPGTLEQQRAAGGAQKSSAGPSQTDFHRVVQGSQGTMGIVTWITMRAELKPSVEETFLLGGDSLDELVPFVYEVQRPWLGEHSFILDRTCAAMLMSAQDERGSGPGNGKSFDTIRDSLPAFVCLQNIAGFERMPKERVEYQLADVRRIAKRHGLSMRPELGAISADALLRAARTPSENGGWRHATRGDCLSIFFLTTLDRAPDLLETFTGCAGKSGFDKKRIASYVQPVVQNHACHVELMIPFSGKNSGDVEALRKFEKNVVSELAEAGAFFSRPYGRAQEIAFAQNPLNHDVLKKMKTIFDPNRVLNRGKWGL
jgi:FAD/FMN-containing dehydrogenase